MNNNFGYGVLTDVDVKQIEDSLDLLKSTFEDEPINLLEIGIHKGRTARSIRNRLKKIGLTNYTYWAVDAGNVNNPFEGCNLVRGTSEESFDQLPDLHWVFIDGCHCVNHVMLDFLNYGHKVAKDGFLLFHDTGPNSQGNHYQNHGPKNPNFHIATLRAFSKLDIFNRKDWKHISSNYDVNNMEWGGVSIFQKTLKSERMINFTAKEGQDKWVIEVLGKKENGYFVDIGASNGIANSNTYALEKFLNWNGICVEPNPNMRAFPTLKELRKCICENLCIYNGKTEVDFVNRGRKIETSGIYFDGASDIIHNLVKQKNHGIIKVQAITLLNLLNKHNAPKIIDYLSIDTEGSEWEILKNFDFSQYTFLTLTIENNYADENCQKEKEKRDKIRNLLGNNGYIFKKELYFGEDWFTHETIEQKQNTSA